MKKLSAYNLILIHLRRDWFGWAKNGHHNISWNKNISLSHREYIMHTNVAWLKLKMGN